MDVNVIRRDDVSIGNASTRVKIALSMLLLQKTAAFTAN